jgi:hypothetical protein
MKTLNYDEVLRNECRPMTESRVPIFEFAGVLSRNGLLSFGYFPPAELEGQAQ